MFRHPQIFIACFVNTWGMMIGIVGLMTSCMKGQETYKIQSEVQQEGNTMQYNSPVRGKFNPRDGFRG
jgi:hypothetical protein